MFVFNKFPAFHCRTIAFKADLPHFRCRLGGSTRRKSLYPSSLGTVYRPFCRSRLSGSAVRALMDATPVCSTGWRCATVSRLHRKCGRTLKSVKISEWRWFRGHHTKRQKSYAKRLVVSAGSVASRVNWRSVSELFGFWRTFGERELKRTEKRRASPLGAGTVIRRPPKVGYFCPTPRNGLISRFES
jgi:hypothetical protein